MLSPPESRRKEKSTSRRTQTLPERTRTPQEDLCPSLSYVDADKGPKKFLIKHRERVGNVEFRGQMERDPR